MALWAAIAQNIVFGFGILLMIHQYCYCDEHVYGEQQPGNNGFYFPFILNFDIQLFPWISLPSAKTNVLQKFEQISVDKMLFNKVLFSKNSPQPKNYTLIFKYIGAETSPNITYAKFNVQHNTVSNEFNKLFSAISNSWRPINCHFSCLNSQWTVISLLSPKKKTHPQKSFALFELGLEKGKERTLQATLNIVNGTNVHVTGEIYGPAVSVIDDLSRFTQHSNHVKPKTMTVVYGHNSTKTRNRKINLGSRQPGDKLIEYQTKNVTLSYRFAETEFVYHDEHKHITSVGFSFDVSHN